MSPPRVYGGTAARDRLKVYQHLRSGLSDDARAFFDKHATAVRRGVLFQGSLERFLVHVSRISHVVRPLWIRRLFKFDDITKQRHFLDGWNTRAWRFVGETMCRRSFLEAFSRDPGFWRFVPPEVPLHTRIFDLMHQYLHNHLARESHLLQLVFFARYIYEPAMPIYLLPGSYERIREALKTTQVKIVTAPAATALADLADRSVDAYSIADVSSYLSEPDFGTLMDESCAPRAPKHGSAHAASSCTGRSRPPTSIACGATTTSKSNSRWTIWRWSTNSWWARCREERLGEQREPLERAIGVVWLRAFRWAPSATLAVLAFLHVAVLARTLRGADGIPERVIPWDFSTGYARNLIFISDSLRAGFLPSGSPTATPACVLRQSSDRTLVAVTWLVSLFGGYDLLVAQQQLMLTCWPAHWAVWRLAYVLWKDRWAALLCGDLRTTSPARACATPSTWISSCLLDLFRGCSGPQSASPRPSVRRGRCSGSRLPCWW